MAVPADVIFNWRVEAGEREQHSEVIRDTAGDLFPVDGWEAECIIRDRPGGTVVLHTFPAADMLVDTDNNAVTLTIPALTSLAWAWHTGWYRLVIRNPDTSGTDLLAYRVLSGTVVIDPD